MTYLSGCAAICSWTRTPDHSPRRRIAVRTPGAADQSPDSIEKAHLCDALRRTAWNITQAARIFEIDRVTVYNKIRKYGLRQEW